MELEEKRKGLLIRTVNRFNLNNRGVGKNGCAYWTPEGKRCAIGWELSEEEAKRIEEEYPNETVDTDTVFGLLPISLKDLGRKFLAKIQELHDEDKHWDMDGLSEIGQFWIENEIITKFKLNISLDEIYKQRIQS